MTVLKKLIIVILLSLLLSNFLPLRGETESCVYWGSVILTTNEGTWLENAQANLLICNYYTDEALIHEDRIYFASLYGNQIVVWYGRSMNHPADICLYNLDGSFICGYYVQFSLGNGVFNIMVDENKLYVYMSNSNCAYCFCKDKTEYFYISPKYTSYIFEYHQPNIVEGDWSVNYSKEVVYLYNGESCHTQIYNHHLTKDKGSSESVPPISINVLFFFFAIIILLFLCYCIIKYT